jgi:hypothetical protein
MNSQQQYEGHKLIARLDSEDFHLLPKEHSVVKGIKRRLNPETAPPVDKNMVSDDTMNALLEPMEDTQDDLSPSQGVKVYPANIDAMLPTSSQGSKYSTTKNRNKTENPSSPYPRPLYYTSLLHWILKFT